MPGAPRAWRRVPPSPRPPPPAGVRQLQGGGGSGAGDGGDGDVRVSGRPGAAESGRGPGADPRVGSREKPRREGERGAGREKSLRRTGGGVPDSLRGQVG